MDSVVRATKQVTQLPLQGPLHVGRPNILNKELFLERVEHLLSQKMFSNDGPFVKQLERTVSEKLGNLHVIAVTNATIGLELVLEALEVKGEVILPAFTFVATAHAVVRTGNKPVFCDVNPENGLLDVDEVEKLITPNTAAILPVNVYGNICDVERLGMLAKKHGIKLIYDSAHVLGAQFRGEFVGGHGDAEVFSLHATKFINGFEGGLITTANDELARKLRLLRNFGFVSYDTVDCVATNAKLSEIHAAMALTNFEYLDDIISLNRINYESYKRSLPSWLRLLDFSEHVSSNYQYIVVDCPSEHRDHLVDYLHSNLVLARKYFYPGLHRLKPYRDLGFKLPATEALSERVLCLPTGQDVDSRVIAYICELIAEFGRQRAL